MTLNEEFANNKGQFVGYDTYQAANRDTLRKIKHVDIRTFESADRSVPLSVLDLSRMTLSTLGGSAVDTLDDPVHIISLGEHWSAGTTAPLSTHNNWWALSLTLATGANPTQSVVGSIDLLTDFENDDFISLALPSFPLASITQASSFVDLTSNPSGNFTTGPTASVALSATTVPLINGNSEFRVLRSAFNQNSIDLSAITGVRLRIQATGAATFRTMALRLLSKDWKFSTVDMNTRLGQLVRPVSVNANPTAAPQFNFPILWRAAEVPGENDPHPIDFDVAVGFNTGARTQNNQFILYGRELTEDFLTQLDLNGLSMATLNGHQQPDVGEAMWNSRVQTDLEVFKQGQLQGLGQFDLERTPDFLAASWIQFVVQWTATDTVVALVNTEGAGYQFNLGSPLVANTKYVLVATLNDTSASAAIYPMIGRDQIDFDHPAFNSTLINDDFAYKRRKGRFGWFADLKDGNSYIESIRTRSTTFAEYRSLPFESLTPVAGAELFTTGSPDHDLFTGFGTTDPSVVVDRDRNLTTTNESWRVTDYGTYTYQGVQSNEFEATDLDQLEITLDVYYPSNADPNAGLEFYLKSQTDYLVPLPRPVVFPDQWQSLRLRVPNIYRFQTGVHRLVVVQNQASNPNWWIDNVRIFERSVSWYARADVGDPWDAAVALWTPFKNSTNREFGGVMFSTRDRRLQVRALGHTRESTIAKIQFKPAYAQIGRLIWPDEKLTNLINPVASYTQSNVGRTWTFNGSGSTDADGSIINWYWTISDGSVHNGPIIAHDFAAAGTYGVTLVVTDSNGLTNSVTANHVVT